MGREAWQGQGGVGWGQSHAAPFQLSLNGDFLKGTDRRGQAQAGSERIYREENFSPSAHSIGLGPTPQEAATLLNF